MVISGKRSSPLHLRGDGSVATFTNEDVQHEPFHIDNSNRFSDASRLHCSNNRTSTTIVKVFTYLISVDVRLPESRVTITTVQTDTIDARSARSACVHTASVNIAALMDGGNSHRLRSVFQTWSCLCSLQNLQQKYRHSFTQAERSCSTATSTAAPLAVLLQFWCG